MGFDEVKLLIEEFFNGKFKVKKFLGEGSFAKVYLVNHNYLDTLMAIKIVKEPLSLSTNKKEVFREVTLACQLRHENIISIYDAGVISNFEDGKSHAYFVMEYVPGGDLQHFFNSFMENNMFMPIGRSLDLIRQILNGLNALHSANPPIIHRDLKPNNVLLSFNASGNIIIKISDFGFAKEVTTTISDIDIAGTRPYMAPELFKKLSSTKSDVYAVGVIFYQLLTNRYPYDIDEYSNEELIDLKPWDDDLNSPSYYNKNVFEDLDKIVLKALDINPHNRYDDAYDFLRDIEKAIDEYKSSHVVSQIKNDDYHDEYYEYIVNDSIKEAFRLAKHEKRLNDAIEILEREVLQDYDIRKCYSETLRIWKSKQPDLKLISKAFTVNLKGRNYKLSCNFLKEAIAYNPSLKSKYQHFIDLWEIFIDLENHGSLFKSVVLLENLMDSNSEIKKLYKNILPVLKTYSVDEIVVEAIRLVNLNQLLDGANLMEFAVVVNSQIRDKYAYKMALWKQNMIMHFKHDVLIKNDTIDYAIDLGTTDSVISYFNNGNPIIIKNFKTGEDFTPSVVLMGDDDNIEVGVNARNALLEDNHNAVAEFKQNMGFSVPFKFENSSRVMFPEELSAEVLKELRVSAYNSTGVNIEHAVICVPANSNPIKTRAVNEAAELAGFRSHGLILEPVAVALAYDLKKDKGIWMIYDLGGGTFNVSLIRDKNNEIELIATDGLENLGGNAFDWKIVNELFRPKITNDLNLDDFRPENKKYSKIFAKLKNTAEIAKKDLSEFSKTNISIENLFNDYTFNYTLTRNRLSEIIKPIIEYTFKMSRNLLNDNSLSDGDIDKIILVGGSSQSPIVKDSIKNEFNCHVESSINPLTVVAKGAAIYAGGLEKPQMQSNKELFSVIIEYYKNDEIKGKVFCSDLKYSFLGYQIEFKNTEHSIKVPLTIDGAFKVDLPCGNFEIYIHDKNSMYLLDEKSPNKIIKGNIHIPYLNKSFSLDCADIRLKDLFNKHVRLTNEIEFLKGYSYSFDSGIMEYIGILLEISKRNSIAYNQASIYLDYMDNIVQDKKRDLEFEMLKENVLNKISFVENNGLFDIENIEEILENKDLDKLKQFYSNLIEIYVDMNQKKVIKEVYFNLKMDGIYTNTEKLASELIEKAQRALNINDYEGLFDIITLLYELDERKTK